MSHKDECNDGQVGGTMSSESSVPALQVSESKSRMGGENLRVNEGLHPKGEVNRWSHFLFHQIRLIVGDDNRLLLPPFAKVLFVPVVVIVGIHKS